MRHCKILKIILYMLVSYNVNQYYILDLMFVEAVIQKYYYMRKSVICYRYMFEFLKT